TLSASAGASSLSLHDALPISALPAIATMTSPAKALEIPSDWTAGSSAWMNQSDTNAAPVPAAASSATAKAIEIRGLVSSRPTSEDRKSTRLNSSHDQISYAVF